MEINKNKITTIAYYLPQYHRIKFNDDYWGKGYTEWTMAMKAQPLFKGHYQPHIPADLGFYDLNLKLTRREQAALAQQYGITGFCYWHYWLAKNKQVMEMPFNEVLKDKEITLPFCLAWANHDWHNSRTGEVLIKQCYEGLDDYKTHFAALSAAFHDERYMRIDNKPIFVIFDPFSHPEMKLFVATWNRLAKEEGFDGIFFIGHITKDCDINKVLAMGFNAVNITRLTEFESHLSTLRKHWISLKRKIFHLPYVFEFSAVMKYFVSERDFDENVFPTIISGWDHTPRRGRNALVLNNCSPDIFYQHVKDVFGQIKCKQHKIVFVRAWNEWGEGNHLEPDVKYGLGYLQSIRKNLEEFHVSFQ